MSGDTLQEGQQYDSLREPQFEVLGDEEKTSSSNDHLDSVVKPYVLY